MKHSGQTNYQTGTSAHLPDHAVEVKGLRKTYKGSRKQPPKEALKSIDLSIPRGSLFGLLGPNGAGKSTLINILAGLVIKTSGSAHIWGSDLDTASRQARASIGIVPQELNLDAFFTPREMLELQAGLYGVPKSERQTDRLLAAVGLADKANAYSRTLSGGMRRRLMVAKAMVHAPPVLVLDEPTAGVDIELRQSLWAHVRELNQAGTTVLLTTHYLEEAQELCDTIAIINHGELVTCEPKDKLLRRMDNKRMNMFLDKPMEKLPTELQNWHAELISDHELSVQFPPSRCRVGDVLDIVREAGYGIIDLTTKEADLEDIFLQLTQGAHDSEGGTPRQR